MHYLPTLIKALCLTIALGAPTLAFANQAPTPATPSVEAPVQAPVCASGPSWEEGKDKFIAIMEAQGATYHGVKMAEDGSFAVVFDLRGVADVDPLTPIFVLAFDSNGCFEIAGFLSETSAKDTFGIVLTNVN